MARCPVELLDDIADVIAELKTWAGIVENKPAVLYLSRRPLLHFHLIQGARRERTSSRAPPRSRSTCRNRSPRRAAARSCANCGAAIANSLRLDVRDLDRLDLVGLAR